MIVEIQKHKLEILRLEALFGDEDVNEEELIIPSEAPEVLTCYHSVEEVRSFLDEIGAPSEALASSHGSYYFTTRFNAYRVVKVIETEMSILNQAEQKQHHKEVMSAMLKELRSWHSTGAWKLALRAGAQNVIDSRWAIK